MELREGGKGKQNGRASTVICLHVTSVKIEDVRTCTDSY
jgi:hypothetical protein